MCTNEIWPRFKKRDKASTTRSNWFCTTYSYIILHASLISSNRKNLLRSFISRRLVTRCSNLRSTIYATRTNFPRPLREKNRVAWSNTRRNWEKKISRRVSRFSDLSVVNFHLRGTIVIKYATCARKMRLQLHPHARAKKRWNCRDNYIHTRTHIFHMRGLQW